MPFAVDFGLPFPPQIGPGADEAQGHHLEWLQAHGLVTDRAAAAECTAARAAEAAARCYPHARGSDLDAATDIVGWFMLCDDLLDRHGKAASQTARTIARICAGMEDSSPEADQRLQATPLSNAFKDVWGRLLFGMSPAWQVRFAGALLSFLKASQEERRTREHTTALSVHAYRRLRAQSVSAPLWFALTERTGHFEAPHALFADEHFRALESAGGELVSFINDVYSLEVEEARGDTHNLVLVLQHAQSLSRPAAIAAALCEIGAVRDRFLDLERRMPSTFERLDLNDREQSCADRYLQGIRNVITSTRDWTPNSSRYVVSQATTAVPVTERFGTNHPANRPHI